MDFSILKDLQSHWTSDINTVVPHPFQAQVSMLPTSSLCLQRNAHSGCSSLKLAFLIIPNPDLHFLCLIFFISKHAFLIFISTSAHCTWVYKLCHRSYLFIASSLPLMYLLPLPVLSLVNGL